MVPVVETTIMKGRFVVVRSDVGVYFSPSQLTRLPPTLKRMRYGSDFWGQWFANIRRCMSFFSLGNASELMNWSVLVPLLLLCLRPCSRRTISL